MVDGKIINHFLMAFLVELKLCSCMGCMAFVQLISVSTVIRSIKIPSCHKLLIYTHLKQD